MAAPLFNFQKARETFSDTVSTVLKSIDDDSPDEPIQKLEDNFLSLPGSDSEKRSALDQAFRDELMEYITNLCSQEEFLGIVMLAASAVKSEFCSPSTLFVLLQDIFDSLTLDRCEQVFSFLEDRVSMWKSEVYYNAGKNYLLRMCNDLLRRLSRSKNTVFCGRIQLFLAKLFPLSEKSGLNIMSQFNLENTTTFNTKPDEYDPVRKASVDEKDESMEIEEGETADNPSNIPIDYNLYRKFWSLQDYFRKPTQCYDKTSWKTFTTNCEDVLSCFESFKLEDTKSQRRRRDRKKKSATTEKTPPPEATKPQEDIVYFAKFLTSEKLLDLQLSDSNFRRYVIVQILIMFQYLTTQVRFKSTAQVLTDEQAAWIKQTSERLYKTLRETYPDGEKFSKTIEHFLSREDNWNNWKNENCPSFIRSSDKDAPKQAAGGKKRSMGEDMKLSGGKIIKMGNSELTRLWNLCPDNMSACKVEQRNFLPSLEEFFEEAIEQMDPEAMIEDEYKLVKNPTFAWKSVRLLSRRSPNFFSQAPNAAQKKKSVPEYLEAMLAKIAKEMPSSTADEGSKVEVEDSVDQESAGSGIQDDDQLGDGKPDDDAASQTPDETTTVVTPAQVKLFSAKLTGDWTKVAAELGIPDDDIDYYKKETDDTEAQAMKMLTVWMENDESGGMVATIRCALKEVGLEAIANDVLGELDES